MRNLLAVSILLLASTLVQADAKTDFLADFDAFIANVAASEEDPNTVLLLQELRADLVAMDAELFVEMETEAEAVELSESEPEPLMETMSPSNPTYVRLRYQCGYYQGNNTIFGDDNTELGAGEQVIAYDLDAIPVRIIVTPIATRWTTQSPHAAVTWISGGVYAENCCKVSGGCHSWNDNHAGIFNVTEDTFSVGNILIDDEILPEEVVMFLAWDNGSYFWEAWYPEPVTLAADINGDGLVNLIDLSMLSGEWLMSEN